MTSEKACKKRTRFGDMKGFEMMSRTSLLTIFAAFVFSAAPVFGQATVVLNSDFENGSDRWERRGGVKIKVSSDQAANGEKSLFVSGRKEFWQGAQINVSRLLEPGKIYRLYAAVRLAEKSKESLIKMTIQRGDDQFATVATVSATDGGWQTLSGTFRPSGGDPFLLVYFESVDPRVSFYIDDFRIESFGTGVQQEGTLLKTDFQDGTLQNWLVNSPDVQIFSGAIEKNVVIKVDGRKEAWQGLALDLSNYLFEGRNYEFSIRTSLDAGEPADTVKLRMRQTMPDGEVIYADVASAEGVTDRDWTTVKGRYQPLAGASGFVLSVEAARPTTSFFVDDFELSVPPQ